MFITPRWQNTKLRIGVTPVGFEPTQPALVELESTPLDHSGKVSLFPAHAYHTIQRLMNLMTINVKRNIAIKPVFSSGQSIAM